LFWCGAISSQSSAAGTVSAVSAARAVFGSTVMHMAAAVRIPSNLCFFIIPLHFPFLIDLVAGCGIPLLTACHFNLSSFFSGLHIHFTTRLDSCFPLSLQCASYIQNGTHSIIT
jgi:hypothetical protein